MMKPMGFFFCDTLTSNYIPFGMVSSMMKPMGYHPYKINHHINTTVKLRTKIWHGYRQMVIALSPNSQETKAFHAQNWGNTTKTSQS